MQLGRKSAVELMRKSAIMQLARKSAVALLRNSAFMPLERESAVKKMKIRNHAAGEKVSC
jgi:hypothetical protein